MCHYVILNTQKQKYCHLLLLADNVNSTSMQQDIMTCNNKCREGLCMHIVACHYLHLVAYKTSDLMKVLKDVGMTV